MLQLAYFSKSTEPYPDVRALAEQALPRNAAEEITGVLLHRSGYYLQVLEGPKEVVEDAFLRIIGDDRHERLQILSRRIITGRQFGTWSMDPIQNSEDKQETIANVRGLILQAPHELLAIFEARFG